MRIRAFKIYDNGECPMLAWSEEFFDEAPKGSFDVFDRPPGNIIITRKMFREAMEYGIDNAAMKGNMIDVATEYLFGPEDE
jgi:hypothetical protein